MMARQMAGKEASSASMPACDASTGRSHQRTDASPRRTLNPPSPPMFGQRMASVARTKYRSSMRRRSRAPGRGLGFPSQITAVVVRARQCFGFVRTWCRPSVGDVVRPSGLTLDGRGVENFARVRVPVGKQLAKSIPTGISHIWVTWESNQVQPGVPSNFCWKRIRKLADRACVSVRCHSNLSQIGLCHTSYCQCSGFRQGGEHQGQNAQAHSEPPPPAQRD